MKINCIATHMNPHIFSLDSIWSQLQTQWRDWQVIESHRHCVKVAQNNTLNVQRKSSTLLQAYMWPLLFHAFSCYFDPVPSIVASCVCRTCLKQPSLASARCWGAISSNPCSVSRGLQKIQHKILDCTAWQGYSILAVAGKRRIDTLMSIAIYPSTYISS